MNFKDLSSYKVNFILAICLVLLGLWSYDASGRDFHTLSIPAMGVILSFFHKPLKNEENKWIVWILALTAVYVFILIMPLRNSMNSGNQAAVLRVSLMFTFCFLALVFYIIRYRSLKQTEIKV